MNYKCLFLSFVLTISTVYSVFSQNTFEKTLYTGNDSEFRFAIETSDGDFLLSGHESGGNDYIVKISSEGDSLVY